jgi:hypothetical protein
MTSTKSGLIALSLLAAFGVASAQNTQNNSDTAPVNSGSAANANGAPMNSHDSNDSTAKTRTASSKKTHHGMTTHAPGSPASGVGELANTTGKK